MADGISVFQGKKFLDLLFSQAAYTPPTSVACAAFTTAPTDRAGTGLVEVTNANSYARVAITNNATNFPAATGSTSELKAIANNIVFATPTGSWGTVVAFGFSDSATYGAGNWLAFYTLATSLLVNAGQPLIIATANLSLT